MGIGWLGGGPGGGTWAAVDRRLDTKEEVVVGSAHPKGPVFVGRWIDTAGPMRTT